MQVSFIKIISLFLFIPTTLPAAFNVICGEYCETHTDLAIEGVSWQRFYNGAEGSGLAAGRGWHFNHPMASNSLLPDMRYHYDDSNKLVRFEVANNDAQGFDIDYSEEKPLRCSVQAPDGRRVDYYYGCGELSSVLHKVIFPDGGWYRYQYQKHPSEDRMLVAYRETAEGNYLINEYYTEEEGYSAGRLKRQLAPVGLDAEPLPTHTFSYCVGATEMLDALGNKTIYRYGEHQRLTAIESYIKNDEEIESLYRIERFYWHAGINGPVMIAQTLENHQGTITTCTTFTYDEQGNITKETLWGNLTGAGDVAITVDQQGQPLSEDVEHYSIAYEYSTAPHIPSEVNLAEFSQGQLPQLEWKREDNGTATRHCYEGNTLQAKLIYCDGVICQRSFYFYDDEGRLIKAIMDDGSAEECSDLSEVTMRKETITTYCEEPCWRRLPAQIEEHTWKAGSSPHEQIINTTHYQYNEAGKPVRKQVYSAEGERLEDLSFAYDVMGRTSLTTDPQGNSVATFYDADGRKVLVATADHHGKSWQTAYRYDKAGRLIATELCDDTGRVGVSTQSHDLIGNVVSTRDRYGNVTKNYYDSLGRRIACLHPEVLDANDQPIVLEETWEYDLEGRPVVVYDTNGRRTAMSYNVRGDVTEIVYPDGTREKLRYQCDGTLWQVTARNDTIMRYEKKRGKLIKAFFIGSDGKEMAFALPEAMPETIDKDGVASEPSRDPKAHTIHRDDYYNERGQNVAQRIDIDPAGNKSVKTYDALGRIERVEIVSATGQRLQHKELRYDGVGHKTKEAYFSPEGELLFSVFWNYGTNGQVASLVEMAADGTQTRTDYAYNSLGQLLAFSKGDSVTLWQSYNSFGQLSEQVSSDHTIHYRYTYNEQGNAIEIADLINNEVTKRSFDSNNQMIVEQLGNGLQLSYEYNERGKKNKLVLPDMSAIDYTYEDDNLKQVRRLAADGKLCYSHTYEKFCHGKQISAEMIADLGQVTYEYDSAHRLSSIHSPYWQLAIALHDYDDSGNILKFTTCDVAPIDFCYSYDALRQLTSEQGEITTSFSYDTLENRQACDSVNYGIAAAHRLVTRDDESYEYDKRGNLIAKKSNQQQISYGYDALNRLTTVEELGLWKLVYRYDAFNRRTGQTEYCLRNDSKEWEAINTQKFIYDGPLEIGSIDNQGNWIALRVLGQGIAADIGAVVALELEGKVFAALSDHRGSLCCLIDCETRQPCEYYRYTAYGQATVIDSGGQKLSGSALGNPWLFLSKRFDDKSGLYYFGQRYYDPALGRWLTPDPLQFADGPNPYTFVHNNPISHADIHGLWTFKDIWQSICSFMDSLWQKFLGFLQRIRDFFQLDTLEEQFEEAAKEVVGPMLLVMFGYYPAHPEVGVYGDGEVDDKVRVTFVNGMLNIKSDFMESVKILSSTHGNVNIHYIFRPTGGWSSDVIDSILVKCGCASEQAWLLAATWKKLIEEMGGVDGGGKILHYAHSIGSGDTLIARDLLSPEEQKMIMVMTFGSPIMIPNEGFGHVINFVSVRDAIPLLDLSAHIDVLSYATYTINYVGTYLGIPFIDHLFNGTTYRAVLESLGQQFINLYQN